MHSTQKEKRMKLAAMTARIVLATYISGIAPSFAAQPAKETYDELRVLICQAERKETYKISASIDRSVCMRQELDRITASERKSRNDAMQREKTCKALPESERAVCLDAAPEHLWAFNEADPLPPEPSFWDTETGQNTKVVLLGVGAIVLLAVAGSLGKGGRKSQSSSSYNGKRDPSNRAAFHRNNPCPSTGKTSGACPGFEVDHRKPLAAGGSDSPSNMQWLSVSAHRAKTSQEWATCVYGC
jgi:hypothetical protein